MNLRFTILFIFFCLCCHFYGFSQIVIDDFNDNTKTYLVPGSSKITLEEVDSMLTVTANGVGPDWEGFAKAFSPLNMSKHTIISLRIKVPTTSPAPTIRMDVTDINGFDSNLSPLIILPPADGQYHTYTFNFKNKFTKSFPSPNAPLNPAQIVRLYFFINPGFTNNPYTGTFYMDDIVLLDAQDPKVISQGAVWKFSDKGTYPGATWNEKGFDDTGWAADTAQFGFGDLDEKTVISYGADPSNKHITSYFRKTFSFVDTTAYKNLILNTLSDDGVVVYINGSEVYRHNLPSGPITEHTFALAERTDSAEENSFKRIILPETVLDSGLNVIAAEVHQASSASEDLSFDLSLTATTYNLGLVRGPYLQAASDTSIVIRWRTLEATDSRVRFGSSHQDLLNIVDSTTLTTEHEVVVTDLSAFSKYYYAIGTSTDTLSGADPFHYFTTNPSKGDIQPVKMWVVGDAGKVTNDQRSVRDAYYTYRGSDDTDVWLLLGDNAYNDGTDEEYQLAMFENMFEELMKRTVIWPTPGNHDLGNYTDPEIIAPYYKIFTVPTAGESGGEPSGTKAYYSFDYANIHFISLDSYGTPRGSTEAMAEWLKNDLAANTQKWTIAYWHHPPYSKGSHDSDDPMDSDGRLVEMREEIVPLLEEHGVDLVLTGHSHNYERSYLIHKFYGASSEFLDEPHLINGNHSGKRSAGEEYYKNPTDASLPDKGTVYSVLGCSGFTEKKPKWLKQPDNLITNALMHMSSNAHLGSMVIDVHKDTLTASFLDNTGVIRDDFSIIKDDSKNISLVMGTVTGINNGLTKEMNVLKIYPNPFSEKLSIEYSLEKEGMVALDIMDETGRKIKTIVSEKQGKGKYEYRFKSPKNSSGIYTVRLMVDQNLYIQKSVEIR